MIARGIPCSPNYGRVRGALRLWFGFAYRIPNRSAANVETLRGKLDGIALAFYHFLPHSVLIRHSDQISQ